MTDVWAELVAVESHRSGRCLPTLLHGRVEQDLPVGRCSEPGVVEQFLFQLSGAPSRIAEYHQGLVRAFAARNGGQDVA